MDYVLNSFLFILIAMLFFNALQPFDALILVAGGLVFVKPMGMLESAF